MVEDIQGELYTVETLRADLRALGVREGATLLVHSSFKSLGQWVCGGPGAVVLALEAALGEEGTLVMPTHSSDVGDPARWQNPPVPKEWWDTIREQMPAYDPELTSLWYMGVIPDTFRRQKGTLRSGHPQVSFAARGREAETIIGDHGLEFGLGERSPLARIYELRGEVLLLGVGHVNNTSMHLAECLANYSGKEFYTAKAPVLVDGEKRWVEFTELEYDSEDFEQLGADFARDTGLVKQGQVAGATALLMPQRELVNYAVGWLERHRGAALG
ncbi:MAG: AAC(3) family N-acetyltransferase [Paenibacillus sp.]|uniref:aminoglycoside N(3)-acetyltransferase n=1 Tax=Paenibacillus sp. TaxID=58172 RepID=UPI002908AB58|nr:AAC(3) family N-acetyltransferase [Paenibacillus sp.]MDU4698264.1 AAC(3) family N-acetyltransferase [Paenibacillus sp.]